MSADNTARRWDEWADQAIDEIAACETKEAWVKWVTDNCVTLYQLEDQARPAWEDVRAANHIKAERLWKQ